VIYKYGKGVTQDEREALKWFRLAAEQGHAEAQNFLGEIDYKEELKWNHKAAEQGDAKAQTKLGGIYIHGEGVTQDYKEAVKWWRLAAEQGYSPAQFYLGMIYKDGKVGVIKDMVIAHMWFDIAASSGHVTAKAGRDFLESKMTSEQIAKAQELARQCIESNYKDCG
jgi:TPR repeat protein